jgi:hypothetical protein
VALRYCFRSSIWGRGVHVWYVVCCRAGLGGVGKVHNNVGAGVVQHSSLQLLASGGFGSWVRLNLSLFYYLLFPPHGVSHIALCWHHLGGVNGKCLLLIDAPWKASAIDTHSMSAEAAVWHASCPASHQGAMTFCNLCGWCVGGCHLAGWWCACCRHYS